MILLLSTSDTDLLSARASGAGYRPANPARTDVADLPGAADGADIVVVRLLGGRRAWEEGLDAAPRQRAAGGGARRGGQAPDAELMELSTVPGGVVAEAHAYLAAGRPGEPGAAGGVPVRRDPADRVGFAPPRRTPLWGRLERPAAPGGRPGRSASCSTGPTTWPGTPPSSHVLCDAVEAAGGRPLPVFCSSLRTAPAPICSTCCGTRGRAGGDRAGGRRLAAGRGGSRRVDEEWDVGALAALDVPILQALCLTSSRARWAGERRGAVPARRRHPGGIPEFDGRLITVPFSFKEIDADGLTAYVADPERAARVAGIAVSHARLRHLPPARRSGSC